MIPIKVCYLYYCCYTTGNLVDNYAVYTSTRVPREDYWSAPHARSCSWNVTQLRCIGMYEYRYPPGIFLEIYIGRRSCLMYLRLYSV